MSSEAPDLHQVRAFVAERYGDGAAATVAPAGSGEWSSAYSLRALVESEGGQRDLVIRFGRHRADFAKDKIVGALAAGTALPVPRVFEIGRTPWGHFVTAQRCGGRYLDDLDGAGMSAVLPDLLRTLDRIGAIDPPGAGFGPWDGDGAAPHTTWRDALMTVATEQPRTAGWRRRLDSRPGPAAVFDRGVAELDARLRHLDSRTAGAARRIVHGDLLNRNVLVAGPSVTAVLDWGNALYGDPLYDAAWLLFWWPWYPEWSGIDIGDEIGRRLATNGVRRDDIDLRMATYQLHIGLDSLTYNAFTGRWDSLGQVADQVDALLRAGRPHAGGT